MKQKLDQSKLEEVNGGTADLEHVLTDYKVEIAYKNASGDFQTTYVLFNVYKDTLRDKDGNYISYLVDQWCAKNGYMSLWWKGS